MLYKNVDKVLTSIKYLHNASVLVSSHGGTSEIIRESNILINDAFQLSLGFMSDDDVNEPTYFPPEQLVGIFGSFIIPLILPYIVSFSREWKRYTKLVNGIKI